MSSDKSPVYLKMVKWFKQRTCLGYQNLLAASDAPIIGRWSVSADYYADIGLLLFTMYYDGVGY